MRYYQLLRNKKIEKLKIGEKEWKETFKFSSVLSKDFSKQQNRFNSLKQRNQEIKIKISTVMPS